MAFPNPAGSKIEIFGGASQNHSVVSEGEWKQNLLNNPNGKPITVEGTKAEKIYGYTPATLQTDITVEGNKILGTINYVDSGELAEYWKNNWFLALDFTTIPEDATSVTLELVPSQGSGPAELINDPDKNAACSLKVNSAGRTTQKLVVKTTTPTNSYTQTFDLSGLVCAAE